MIVRVLIVLLLGLPAAARTQVVVDPPILLGQVATPDDAFEVVLSGDYAFVPDYAMGLEIISIVDPANLSIVGSYNTPGFSIQCALAGGRAFIADHVTGGLQIVNVSNPVTPTHIGSYVPGGAALMTAWRDGVVLVGYVQGGIDFVDVSTPSAPSLITSFATTGAPRHAVFDGPYAFVADFGFGLRVLEVSDASNPTGVGGINVDRPLGIDLVGTTLYLACENGLRTIDVSNATAPTALHRVALPGPAIKVDVAGNYALVAAHVAGGLQVVDVSDATRMSIVTSYVTGRYAHGVAARDDVAFLADGEGLKAFRVFDSAVEARPTSFGRLKALYKDE